MAAGTISLEIVTPEKSVVSDEAQIVMAPGSEGEFGVLANHTPFLTTLKIGTVRYTDAGGAERYVYVSGGYAEALPDKVTIIAEEAERRRDIDVERAKDALERAQQRLDAAKDAMEYARAKAALERELHKLRTAERR